MMRFACRLGLVMLTVAAAGHAATPTDLDDVWCTVCHFEQGDAFATSVHYQKGLLLCTDCHGGDADEPDGELAKAPSTGFIGRPTRQEIAPLCGTCHIGPAQFFSDGPHADPQHPDNPTCVTCHQNHAVVAATLTLMDTTCAACHRGDDRVMSVAQHIQTRMGAADGALAAVAARFDSLSQVDPSLLRSAGLLSGAGASLRQVSPRTHALRVEDIDATLASFTTELAQVSDRLDESVQSRSRRGWIVVGVWAFVALNVIALWLKRRELESPSA